MVESYNMQFMDENSLQHKSSVLEKILSVTQRKKKSSCQEDDLEDGSKSENKKKLMQ